MKYGVKATPPTSPTDLFIDTLPVSPHSLQVAKLDAHNLTNKGKTTKLQLSYLRNYFEVLIAHNSYCLSTLLNYVFNLRSPEKFEVTMTMQNTGQQTKWSMSNCKVANKNSLTL